MAEGRLRLDEIYMYIIVLAALSSVFIVICNGQDLTNCSSQPCMNNATCTDNISNYTCTCVPGFTGDSCEILLEVDDCLAASCPVDSMSMDGGSSAVNQTMGVVPGQDPILTQHFSTYLLIGVGVLLFGAGLVMVHYARKTIAYGKKLLEKSRRRSHQSPSQQAYNDKFNNEDNWFTWSDSSDNFDLTGIQTSESLSTIASLTMFDIRPPEKALQESRDYPAREGLATKEAISPSKAKSSTIPLQLFRSSRYAVYGAPCRLNSHVFLKTVRPRTKEEDGSIPSASSRLCLSPTFDAVDSVGELETSASDMGVKTSMLSMSSSSHSLTQLYNKLQRIAGESDSQVFEEAAEASVSLAPISSLPPSTLYNKLDHQWSESSMEMTKETIVPDALPTTALSPTCQPSASQSSSNKSDESAGASGIPVLEATEETPTSAMNSASSWLCSLQQYDKLDPQRGQSDSQETDLARGRMVNLVLSCPALQPAAPPPCNRFCSSTDKSDSPVHQVTILEPTTEGHTEVDSPVVSSSLQLTEYDSIYYSLAIDIDSNNLNTGYVTHTGEGRLNENHCI